VRTKAPGASTSRRVYGRLRWSVNRAWPGGSVPDPRPRAGPRSSASDGHGRVPGTDGFRARSFRITNGRSTKEGISERNRVVGQLTCLATHATGRLAHPSPPRHGRIFLTTTLVGNPEELRVRVRPRRGSGRRRGAGQAVNSMRAAARAVNGLRTVMQGYSGGVCRLFCVGALLGRFGRCYPSRAPDAGTLAGTFGGSPEEQVERSNPAPHSGVRGPRTLAPSWSAYRHSPGRRVGDSFSSELQGHDRTYGREARMASRSR
jgi:hypothetical protein